MWLQSEGIDSEKALKNWHKINSHFVLTEEFMSNAREYFRNKDTKPPVLVVSPDLSPAHISPAHNTEDSEKPTEAVETSEPALDKDMDADASDKLQKPRKTKKGQVQTSDDD